MGRLWQAAGTVASVLTGRLIEWAAEAGLRSLFVGFETTNPDNLVAQRKTQNLNRDYGAAIRRLHDLGVMVNGSFVFGMDGDDPSVFDATVEWAVEQGIETATFHILTPYPSTALYARIEAEGRILHRDWDRYDTRHAVFRPARMAPEALEEGYWRAYEQFYRWGSIFRGASTHAGARARLRHVAYAAGWRKFERGWDLAIRAKRVAYALPVLESILSGFGGSPAGARERPPNFPDPGDSALALGAEHRLHVEDGRPVERLQVPHEQPRAIDGDDFHPVQSDRVRPVRRAGAEDARLRPRQVAAGVNDEHIATRPVEPGQQDDLGPNPKVAQAVARALIEDKVGVRRALVALLWSHADVEQRRFDPPDRPQDIPPV